MTGQRPLDGLDRLPPWSPVGAACDLNLSMIPYIPISANSTQLLEGHGLALKLPSKPVFNVA
jgi:hypothetical protein